MRMLRAFLKDESGVTAVAYALLAAGVSIAIISAVKGMVPNSTARFRRYRPN
jgi:Flp pilus assembly pilin Flp